MNCGATLRFRPMSPQHGEPLLTRDAAIVKVLTFLATGVAAYCIERHMSTEDAVRLGTDLLDRDTTRRWAARQVLALTTAQKNKD